MFFLDRARVALRGEARKRSIPFVEQERCRLVIVGCRDWVADHEREMPEMYREKYEQVRRTIGESLAIW
jgi:hypothetical protein